jgi:hypothetical protein
MNKKNKPAKEFHTVDFIRKVRDEVSDLYNAKKKQYFKEIKQAMEDFKARQKKTSVDC